MGIFDKVKDMASQHSDQVSKEADKAEQVADEKTGGKYTDQINSGMQTAQDKIGVQPTGQDPAQSQGDPSAQDPMGQGQDMNQDLDQDQHQYPTQ
jgi:hypothetical protein